MALRLRAFGATPVLSLSKGSVRTAMQGTSKTVDHRSFLWEGPVAPTDLAVHPVGATGPAHKGNFRVQRFFETRRTDKRLFCGSIR